MSQFPGRVAVRASNICGVVDLFDVASQTVPAPPAEAIPLPPSTFPTSPSQLSDASTQAKPPPPRRPSAPAAVSDPVEPSQRVDPRPLLGMTSSGYSMRAFYRPTVLAFSDELSKAIAADANPNVALPLPQGWRFSMAGKASKKLALSLDTPSAKRFRSVFGYVGFIKNTLLFYPGSFHYPGVKPVKSDGTASPLHAQVVLKLPFYYGESDAEWKHSFLYARVNAFASKAALPCSFQVLAIGSVVRGLVEKAHSDHETAQLAVYGRNFSFFLLSVYILS